ncbi:hypothetical protein [Nocardia sp. NPDC059228]
MKNGEHQRKRVPRYPDGSAATEPMLIGLAFSDIEIIRADS